MKLIYIEWSDAFSKSKWHTKEEIEKFSNSTECIIRQTGWVYKETKRSLVLVGSHIVEEDFGEEEFGNLEKIPKTWIRKRIDLTKHIK